VTTAVESDGAEAEDAVREGPAGYWLWLPLALAVAFRGATRDTELYVDIFNESRNFPFDPIEYAATHGVEWGYGVLSWAFHALGLGPRALLFLFSAWTFRSIERTARCLGLSFYEVAPFYLGTFFLTQQLMQMRQGLATALAMGVIVGSLTRTGSALRLALEGFAAASIHVASTLPLACGFLLRRISPPGTRRRLIGWTIAIVLVIAVVAHLVTSLDWVMLIERLATYADDEEFTAARSVLDPANVRGVLLLAAFVAATPSVGATRPYLVLLGLYAAHVGVRFGFLGFAIMSGRLSTALGFVEIFLLPMVLKRVVRDPRRRVSIGLAYLVVHLAATLLLQAPYLVDDYFTALHTGNAAR
jgi:hypothetical protein